LGHKHFIGRVGRRSAVLFPCNRAVRSETGAGAGLAAAPASPRGFVPGLRTLERMWACTGGSLGPEPDEPSSATVAGPRVCARCPVALPGGQIVSIVNVVRAPNAQSERVQRPLGQTSAAGSEPLGAPRHGNSSATRDDPARSGGITQIPPHVDPLRCSRRPADRTAPLCQRPARRWTLTLQRRSGLVAQRGREPVA
jgi:hypothetical protein